MCAKTPLRERAAGPRRRCSAGGPTSRTVCDHAAMPMRRACATAALRPSERSPGHFTGRATRDWHGKRSPGLRGTGGVCATRHHTRFLPHSLSCLMPLRSVPQSRARLGPRRRGRPGQPRSLRSSRGGDSHGHAEPEHIAPTATGGHRPAGAHCSAEARPPSGIATRTQSARPRLPGHNSCCSSAQPEPGESTTRVRRHAGPLPERRKARKHKRDGPRGTPRLLSPDPVTGHIWAPRLPCAATARIAL